MAPSASHELSNQTSIFLSLSNSTTTAYVFRVILKQLCSVAKQLMFGKGVMEESDDKKLVEKATSKVAVCIKHSSKDSSVTDK